MNDLSFIVSSLKSRWLNSLLSILLTAFGVTISLLIIQFGNHFQDRLKSDGKGIDIVVGAKGSPLQLILSSVYHVDVPTGNISYDSIKKISKNPQVKSAIPLALGDNWRGHRIVGTTIEYLKLYNTDLLRGKLWSKDFEVVIGSLVNLKINDEIIGSHGLFDEGGEHSDHKYKVTGILKPSGTVLDRLIITSVNSVLDIHGQEHINDHDDRTKHHDHENDLTQSDAEHSHDKKEHHNHHHENDLAQSDSKHDHEQLKNKNQTFVANKSKASEITALLITTNSPIANVNLPRSINKESSLQAANPALEITRLTSMLGMGTKSFSFLSFVLIIIAILSIFSGLASNLENRMGDLAILRAIGYSKYRIFKIITLEGLIIIFFGVLMGLIFGILIFNIFTQFFNPLKISLASFKFSSDILLIFMFIFAAGFLASIFPAYKASKISVANQLSKNV